MAADNWTITDATRDYVDVTLLINDETHMKRVAVSQITAATQAAALTKLRTQLNEFRNAIIAENTTPTVIQSAIGYTEAF